MDKINSKNFLSDKQLERIQKCMKAVEWGWYGCGIPPSIPEMRKTIDGLLKRVDEKCKWITTGGFLVERSQGPRGIIRTEVSFILESGEVLKRKGKK